MRPSELLALRRKDLVPPLVPLFRCWLIMVAASAGVSAKIGISDGSVVMDRRWLQWVKPAPARTQGGKFGGSLEFQLPCSSENVQDCNRHFEPQEHDHVPNAAQCSQFRSGAWFQNSARSAKTRSVDNVQQCHKIRQKQSSGGRLPLTRARSRTCSCLRECFQLASRVTGARLRNVFSGHGFLTKATHRLGLRGFVLDTKFGPRCDVSQPLVPTRIRQNVSA